VIDLHVCPMPCAAPYLPRVAERHAARGRLGVSSLLDRDPTIATIEVAREGMQPPLLVVRQACLVTAVVPAGWWGDEERGLPNA